MIGGSGRQFIFNTAVINPAHRAAVQHGIPELAGSCNYGTFLQLLPALRAQQEAKYPGTGDQPQILLSKQATALGALYPRDFPTTRANHFNLGFQRELGGDMVAAGRRRLPQDASRHARRLLRRERRLQQVQFHRRARHPAMHRGTSQRSGRAVLLRPDELLVAGRRPPTYKGLLLKADKRFSNRYLLSASYALQFSDSIRDVTQDLNDYFATYGPDLPRHNLTVSGIVDLPWRMQLSVLSTFLSRPPVAPTINGFNNSGTAVNQRLHAAARNSRQGVFRIS